MKLNLHKVFRERNNFNLLKFEKTHGKHCLNIDYKKIRKNYHVLLS